jgi:urocanate hydratase
MVWDNSTSGKGTFLLYTATETRPARLMRANIDFVQMFGTCTSVTQFDDTGMYMYVWMYACDYVYWSRWALT